MNLKKAGSMVDYTRYNITEHKVDEQQKEPDLNSGGQLYLVFTWLQPGTARGLHTLLILDI